MSDDWTGSVQVGGKVAEWRRNPLRGGIIIEFDGLTLRLSGEPSERQIICAVEGFLEGYLQGKQAGRAILQNEFRNLMDCRR